MKRFSAWFAIAGIACVGTATQAQQAPPQAPPAAVHAASTPPPAAPPTAPANGSISSSLGVIVFPAKNQTPQQQQSDEGYCYGWAKTNTNIDPMAIKPSQPQQVAATPDPATAGDGARVGGAARGAAGGAVIGAITGNAGEGAAVGAAAGAMAGGAARRNAKKQAAQQQQQAQAQADQAAQADIAAQKATYNKAFSACMEGKGYTTK